MRSGNYDVDVSIGGVEVKLPRGRRHGSPVSHSYRALANSQSSPGRIYPLVREPPPVGSRPLLYQTEWQQCSTTSSTGTRTRNPTRIRIRRCLKGRCWAWGEDGFASSLPTALSWALPLMPLSHFASPFFRPSLSGPFPQPTKRAHQRLIFSEGVVSQ